MGCLFISCLKKEEDDIIKQSYIKASPDILEVDKTEKLVYQMKNSICKLYPGDTKEGTGFFCKIPFPRDAKGNAYDLIKVLITNNHVINENILKKGKIRIRFKKKLIHLFFKNKIHYYTDPEFDVTIIPIDENENDEIKEFLELDDDMRDNIIDNIRKSRASDININDKYKEELRTIYIIQYPGDKEIPGVSLGIVKGIEEGNSYNFKHSCNTKAGSSGSPILSSNNKLIGIHKEAVIKREYNKGTFLNYPIQAFIESNLYFDIKTN